jgi:hypothetical protein
MPELIQAEDVSTRRARLILRAAVAVVWSVGVFLAIRSGWEPGFWGRGRPWSYPLGHVLVVIAQLTVISLCFYDSLRPQPDSSFRVRTARAALVSFWILVWMTLNTWTDQPGYAYVASTYVLIVTALLLITLAVLAAMRAFRRSGHAA